MSEVRLQAEDLLFRILQRVGMGAFTEAIDKIRPAHQNHLRLVLGDAQ